MLFPIPLAMKPLPQKAKVPVVNVVLIALNVLVYLFGWSDSWAVGPDRSWLTVLTYGFSHFGFWHLLLNMWTLWVFGNPLNRRLGSGYYLLAYLGTLMVIGLFAKLLLSITLAGSSGAMFAVIVMALILMPGTVVDVAYLAVFPLSILLGLVKRPKYGLNWFVCWGIASAPALWCLVIIPLMELCSFIARASYFGWDWSWTPGAHLLGMLCGVAAVLMLPTRITMGRRSMAGI